MKRLIILLCVLAVAFFVARMIWRPVRLVEADELSVLLACDDVEEFGDGFSFMKDLYGFVNSAGELVVPCEYDEVGICFSGGLAYVMKDGKYGYVDTVGRLVISCEYDYADAFFDGLAVVGKDGRYGIIDTAGKLIVPCMYEDAQSLGGGLARIDDYEGSKLFNTSGEQVASCDCWFCPLE